MVLRAKTGWGIMDNTNVGWYVGYIKTPDNTWFFSNCIQSKDSTNKNFATARKEIVFAILKELKILK